MVASIDTIVYYALGAVVLVMGFGAVVIIWTPESADAETRKLRFAAATFTGITMLFVFISLLYFADRTTDNGPGQQIFEKGFTALFTLAGTIVGYLFGSKSSVEVVSADRRDQRQPGPDPRWLNRTGR